MHRLETPMVSVVMPVHAFPQTEGTVKMKPKTLALNYYVYRPYNLLRYYRTLLWCRRRHKNTVMRIKVSMKKIVVILLTILLVGCSSSRVVLSTPQPESTIYHLDGC